MFIWESDAQMKLTREQVRHVAELAKLKLTGNDEQEKTQTGNEQQ